nr:PREDICTED: NCK-interacting protein with SH3 domain [Bemisia tabaci]
MDSSGEHAEDFEIIVALYDFQATFAKTISFNEHDKFLIYNEHTRERNWWQVVNQEGHIGYIPCNYVKIEKCPREQVVAFLEVCIESIRKETNKSPTSEKQELLKKLVQKKESLINFSEAVKLNPSAQTPDGLSAPLPPRKSCSSDDDSAAKSSKSTVKPFKEMAFDSKTKNSLSNSKINSPKRILTNGNKELAVISTETVYHIVQLVRTHTDLSHELSRVAVSIVIESLIDMLPSECVPNLENLLEILQRPLYARDSSVSDTFDGKRLQNILEELISCKEDSQQRSWELYEDESIIIEYLTELLSILNNADINICRHVLSKDQFRAVCALIEYYQMETRWSIRQPLLQTFGVMCGIHASVITVLLNSVLPMELARDMMSNPENVPRLLNSALLLSMIFSMGESMPITHLEYLGLEFVTFLLSLIESPPETDIEEQIPDVFLTLILSYNLQFSAEATNNVVVDSVASRSVAKNFTEKVLILLNREEDPVRIFDHTPAPPDSVLKLFLDLFSNEQAANLFYTNDMKVLIDVIVRQIADVSPGDTKRTRYLQLCRLVLNSTNYAEHQHRKTDLQKCFSRILSEELSESQPDIMLVQEISNEFPQYFKSS